MSAADIRAALVSYYAPPSHRVFFEVSNDTGARARRRVDAVALGVWPSTGHEIIGIEIKTSRSDWRRELEDASKAQALMRFCTRWFLACPEGLVTDADVPATWGVLTLRAGTSKLRINRPAPLLTPEPLTRGFMMACLRNANGADDAVVQALARNIAAEEVARITRGVEARVRRDVASALGPARGALAFMERMRTLLRSDDPATKVNRVDARALAAAYFLVTRTRVHERQSPFGGGLLGAIGNLERTLKLLNDIHEDARFVDVRNLLEKNDAS